MICCSVAQSCPTLCDPTPWTAASQAFLLLTISWSLLNSCPLNLWCPPTNSSSVYPPLLPLVFHSIRVFFSESTLCINSLWPKDWSFSISPSNEYSGLTSFRINWFDLFAVQRTLKSLLQHHSLKASILWCSAFFIVQLSHPYMATGKAIALSLWTFIGIVVSLLFNTLSSFEEEWRNRPKEMWKLLALDCFQVPKQCW